MDSLYHLGPVWYRLTREPSTLRRTVSDTGSRVIQQTGLNYYQVNLLQHQYYCYTNSRKQQFTFYGTQNGTKFKNAAVSPNEVDMLHKTIPCKHFLSKRVVLSKHQVLVQGGLKVERPPDDSP